MAKYTLFSGESKNVEYKVTVPEKSEKYMKTVVAFANGKGGRIVFGIDDKTLEIVGMDTENIFKTMDAITNAISDACEPSIRPDVSLQSIDDKTVIVAEILPGAQRPYYIKSQGIIEGTYVRVAGTTRHIEGYMLKELILEGQNRYYDSEICTDIKISENDIEQLCKKMKEIAVKNSWQDSARANIKDVTKNVLISWGVLKEAEGKVYPTNAYALLTGQMPQQPEIQCGIFKGTDRAYFIDRREFEGSIYEQAEAAYQYVLEKINMGMKIQGIYRQDIYELPPDSIRELIANAVAHRSYLEPGNIQVALFDDRLEVTSPGMLLNNVSIRKMIEGYSKPRNPAIARAFAYMKIIEKWGTGIPRIFRECREYGLPQPELIDFDGDFKVKLYRRIEDEFGIDGAVFKTNTEIGAETSGYGITDTETDIEMNFNEKTNTEISAETNVYGKTNIEIGAETSIYGKTNAETDTETRIGKETDIETAVKKKTNSQKRKTDSENVKKILELISVQPDITARQLAGVLNLSLSGVRYHINKLKKAGVLEHIGASKKGIWVIHSRK